MESNIEQYFNISWTKTKKNLKVQIDNSKSYKDIIAIEWFAKFFSPILIAFNNRVNEYGDEFDINYRVNWLKKAFKNATNEEEENQSKWEDVHKEWIMWTKKIYISDLDKRKNNIYKNYIFEYFSNINTMMKTNDNEEDEFIGINNSFLDRSLKPSFSESDNPLLDILTLKEKDFKSNKELGVFLFSNKDHNNNLNVSQLLSLYKTHTNKITNIKGPPGTGKTTLLKDIVSSLFLNGKTMVISSTNNSAVDNVLKVFSKDPILGKLPMIRTGRKEIWQTTYEKLMKWLEDNEDLEKIRIKEKSKKLVNISNEIINLKSLINSKENANSSLSVAKLLISCSEDDYDKNYDIEKQISLCYKIISIAKKIKSEKNWLTIINGYIRWANKKKIKKIKKFISAFDLIPFNIKIDSLKFNKSELIYDLKSAISICIAKKEKEKLEKSKAIKKIQKYINSTAKYTRMELNNKNILYSKRIYTTLKKVKKYVELLKSNDHIITNVDGSPEKFHEGVILKNVFKNKDNYKIDGVNLSSVFPIVFTTAFYANSMFDNSHKIDYCIIDEAAQTSIHSILGITKRFRNMIFLGDTSQLEAVVVKDEKKEEVIFEESNLPKVYRNNKNSIPLIIERVFPKDISHMLNEHWRCVPDIANFFNKYYGGKLRVMRNHIEDSIIFEEFEGSFQSQIKRLEEKYKKELEDQENQKIAIMSPFKNVSNLKGKTKIKKFGTIHKFQGYENNVILFYIDRENLGYKTITNFLDNPNLINVAVSRAKNKFHLLISKNNIDAIKSVKDSEMYNLIKYIQSINKSLKNRTNVLSNFQNWINNNPKSSSLELGSNYLSKINRSIFNIARKNGWGISFGVRDIDVNAEIKNINNHKEIFDIVIFDNEANVQTIINNQVGVYVRDNDVKDKFKHLIEFENKINKTKMFMSSREVYYWNKFNDKIKSKKGKILLPCVSMKKIIKDSTTKMHFDFVFADYYEHDNNYYFNHNFILELDDKTHERKKNKENDKKKDFICKNNKINLIRLKI